MRAWFAIGLATAGCRSSLPFPSEAELARNAQSVVREPAFTLISPYDGATTAAYADAVRSEVGLVRTLFADEDATPVRIYLVPIEDEAGRELNLWQTPSRGGVEGAAMGGEYAFVYVPMGVQAASARTRAGLLQGGTLRHELAHLYAKRAGLSRPTWFDEGLAMEVECMRAAEHEKRKEPVDLAQVRSASERLRDTDPKLLWMLASFMPCLRTEQGPGR